MDKLYLYLNLFTISIPLILSFDKKVAFYRNWKYLFPAIFIMVTLFIAWDAIFTYYGIWSFNDDYLIGFRMLGLPLEEWMFFIVVPYACVFIYACLIAYLKVDPLKKIYRPFLLVLSFILIVSAAIHFNRLYTSITFFATSLLILYNLKKNQPWLSMFLLSYFVIIIPFLTVNGILTGSFIDDQVVWYNPAHILNIRIGTIPVEDIIYNLMMLMMTV
ncbi:MAG: lycopene cyclase domain-containing protein, partial [Bacteroidales bacterium]